MKRVTGEERRELALEVRRLYEEEQLKLSDVAGKLQISYGKAHALLKESGATARRKRRNEE